MADKKTKAKLQASEVMVGNRSVEAVLLDLAERARANEERAARNEERVARNEELITIALRTIAAVSQDLRAITEEFRGFNRRIDERVTSLEKPAAE